MKWWEVKLFFDQWALGFDSSIDKFGRRIRKLFSKYIRRLNEL